MKPLWSCWRSGSLREAISDDGRKTPPSTTTALKGLKVKGLKVKSLRVEPFDLTTFDSNVMVARVALLDQCVVQ